MISGRVFADRCDWIFDYRYQDKRYSAILAKTGDWVFINGDQLYTIDVFAGRKFNWIVHNSDRSFGMNELNFLLPHAIKIYAINTSTTHPILTTIPIGFADKTLPLVTSFKRPNIERDIKIYGNFTPRTNFEKRNHCYDIFKNNENVVFKSEISTDEFYNDLCRSKFVLCPEGTGLDTHRVYESLLCGATPVVLRNSLSTLYEKLPVCIVDSWTDEFYVPKGVAFFNINLYL
jgi:hypothetical protein